MLLQYGFLLFISHSALTIFIIINSNYINNKPNQQMDRNVIWVSLSNGKVCNIII